MQNLIASSQHSLIIGLGVTGLSVARYFARTGKSFSVADNRETPPGLDAFKHEFPDVHVSLGPFNAAEWENVHQIILSPGVARETPAIQTAINNAIEVIGDVELFSREATAPIVAITGSNGKTTVTTLVGEMAKEAGVNVKVGGNIGTPVLDLLDANDASTQSTELYVLELSSFQLESTIKLNAKVATILNVSADHMDRYSSLHDYMRAKQKIFFGAQTIVFNRDDALTHAPMATDRQYVSFGLSEPDLKDWGLRKEILEQGESQSAEASSTVISIAKGLKNHICATDLYIRGTHNLLNAQAALAVGEAAGLPLPAMLQALSKFRGLAHRCQFVAAIKGVSFYNDSKGTNVGATVAAINGLATGKNVVLIAGGDGKGADFQPLANMVNRHVKTLITIGVDGNKISDACDSACVSVRANSLEQAVALACEHATQGDVVLLSPACASFDMFKSYEERGAIFVETVEALCA